MGLDRVLRIRDKMQVAYKEMTYDGAKYNEAKWNLIGGIQFKHVKKCLVQDPNAVMTDARYIP